MAWLFKAFLDWLLAKILSVIAIGQRDKIAHEAAAKQAEEDVKKAKELKPDASAEEIDEAIDDSLKHF